MPESCPAQRSISGCILAGGKGSRMGGDKLWKLYHGRCLIDYPVELLKRLGLTSAVVLAQDQPQPDLLKLRQHYPHLQIILDTTTSQGPLVGIYSALKACPTPWLLVLPTDMPKLRPLDLQPLLELALKNRHQAVIAAIQGELQPLTGLYAIQALPSISQYLHQGGRGPKGWLTQNAQCYQAVEVEAHEHWINMNQPSDLSEQEEPVQPNRNAAGCNHQITPLQPTAERSNSLLES